MSLSNLTLVENGSEKGQDVNIQALDGGRVELPLIEQLVEPLRGDNRGRAISVTSRGTGSTIDLRALETFEDMHSGTIGDGYGEKASQYSELVAAEGGEIQLGKLRSIIGVYVKHEGVLDVSTLEQADDSHLTLARETEFSSLSTINGSNVELKSPGIAFPLLTTATDGWFRNNDHAIDLSTLTNINGRDLYISGGITIDMPLVSDVVNSDGDMLWRVTDAGSVLSLPNLTSIQNGDLRGQDLRIQALDGGQIDLSNVTKIVDPTSSTSAGRNDGGRAVSILAGGTESHIDLSSLLQFDDYNSGSLGEDPGNNGRQYSELVVKNEGTIQLGMLHDARGVYINNDGTIDLSSIMRFTEGHLDLNRPADFTALTTIDGTDVELNVPGVTFPILTSAANGWLKTNGHRIDLSTITNIDGRDLYISNGVEIEMPLVTEVENTDRNMVWQVSGANSRLKLANLISIQNGNLRGQDLHIQALDRGLIDLPNVTTIVDPVSGGRDAGGRAITLLARSVGSQINLASLESFVDYNSGSLGEDPRNNGRQYSELVAADGGDIQIGSLRTIRGVYLTADNGTISGSTEVSRVEVTDSGFRPRNNGDIQLIQDESHGDFVGTGKSFMVAGNSHFTDALSVRGELVLAPAAHLVVEQDLSLSTNSSLQIAANSTLELHGSLHGDASGGTFQLGGNAVFAGSGGVQTLEIQSRHLDSTSKGFGQPTVFRSIELRPGATVRLQDRFGGSHALYANSLVIPEGSTLDLNGFNVYTRGSVQAGTVMNGKIEQILDTGLIELNAPIPASLTVVGEHDEWAFTARKGRQITVHVNASNKVMPGALRPHVGSAGFEVLDASGQILAKGSTATNARTATIQNIEIPSDGTYRVKIYAGGDGTATGNYLIGVWDSTMDESPLEPNKNLHGNIETPYSVDEWTFYGVKGQQVRLDLISRATSSIEFSMHGPDHWQGFSSLQNDSELITLPSSGEYSIRVEAEGNVGRGAYAFLLEEISRTRIDSDGTHVAQALASDQAQLFEIEISDPQPLMVRLQDLIEGNEHEIYARFGLPPTRSDYDQRFSLRNSGPSLTIRRATVGKWYVLVYSSKVQTPGNFSLTTVSSSVVVDNSLPNRIAADSRATLTVTGSGFVPGSKVVLTRNAVEYQAASVAVDSFSQLTAIFAEDALPIGKYDIQVRNPDGSVATLGNMLSIVEGVPAKLVTKVIAPSALGWNGVGEIIVEFANEGDYTMPAPLINFTAENNGRNAARLTLDPSLLVPGFWTSGRPEGFQSSVQFLASGETPGILQPRETGRVTIYWAGWQKPWGTGRFQFFANPIYTTDETTIDWDEIKNQMRPATISPAAWDAVFANFSSQVGDTWGDYVRMLGENADYLHRLGRTVHDVGELNAFEVQQAIGFNPAGVLTQSLDLQLQAPGLDIALGRAYNASLVSRHEMGAFGYGWSTTGPWMLESEIRSDGSIIIQGESGLRRIYQPDSRGFGKFFSPPGDSSSVRRDGESVVLRDAGGAEIEFDSTGHVATIRDTNGNQIAASFEGEFLTQLTHSSGSFLQIDHNSAGRVSRLSDSQGRGVEFEYDSGNEYLLLRAELWSHFWPN